MKIGFILPSLLTSKRYQKRIFAPAELLLLLADGLVDRGHQVIIYSGSKMKTKAEVIQLNSFLEEKNYPSIKDKAKNPQSIDELTSVRDADEYELNVLTGAFSLINKNNLDILHDYLGYLGQYFVKLTSTPTVFTLHDPVYAENYLEYQRLKQFKNHNFIAISNSQKEEYQKQMGLNFIGMIHHGLDLDKFTFSEMPENHMVYLGRVIRQKGVAEAVKLADKLKINFQFASSGNYKNKAYYLQEIKPYLNSLYVKEVGFLVPQTRNIFLQKAKLLLFPLMWSEPFGMTLIESMACGTPVVAYARGSVPEIVKDGETGFLVNTSETEKTGDFLVKQTGFSGLCEAVKRIYSLEPSQYLAMRKACRAHVEANFTAGKMVDNYEKVYQKILSR